MRVHVRGFAYRERKKMKRFLALLIAGLTALVAGQASAGTLTVNQWVQPTENGVLKGRVVLPMTNGTSKAVEGAVVTLIDNNGTAITSDSKTNTMGEFVISGVQPGVYAINARADNVFAACAMHVLDSDLVGEELFPAVAELAAADIDFTTIKMALIRYLPPGSQRATAIAEANIGSIAGTVTGEQSFRVAQINGGMKGRLNAAGARGNQIQAAGMTNVFIMKNGNEVARTITDENGRFEVGQLAAGNYSLMAIGPNGLATIGFELVDESAFQQRNAAVTTNGKQFVFRLPDGEACCEELTMQVAPVVDTQVLTDASFQETVAPFVPAPIQAAPAPTYSVPVSSGGAVGGGASSGGALLGGGGGLGGIAVLGGVGGVIAVTTTSDDDDIENAAPVSPATP